MGRLIDDMRAMIRDDAIACFMPDDDNFERVRAVGGTTNHLGERCMGRKERFPFKCVETTQRGDLDDSERNERVVGGQTQGEIVLVLLEDILKLGDRVERISDGTAYEVVNLDNPKLNNASVSYHAMIRIQTD